ncbi:protein EMBRYONIC FLOWER 1-like isoform X2 [Cucurbita maxima]|uniref:Protein EMBRYONIC FLOWER 1-like isoform X2 n=1 Tax=Cucurbita maxima TaxID=3661 RepID=A0A6J1KKL9_CUCMA|nr:protein EMBRYONIC FLOWER 1-like isoform X2 [Cucurbita maxima]
MLSLSRSFSLHSFAENWIPGDAKRRRFVMDSGRINVMEENNHGTDDSKAAEKFIQIDSIYIDLFSSNDKCDGQKCERFSIRGYVSDMSKKDWKSCWPFSDLGDIHKLDEHILSAPPVYDPSFDVQHRKSRWQDSSDKAAEGFVFDNYHSLGHCSIASLKAPKQDVIGGRTVVDNASNSSCQRSGCDEKEKKLEVADYSTGTLFSPIMLRKQTPADHLNGQLTLVASENDSTVDIDRACRADKLQDNGDASMESNESTISSSESAETVGNRPRRRTPKIRLMTELLGENGNMKANKHVQSYPSNGTPEASAQADPRYASKCLVTMGENIWNSGHKRQRRLPRIGKSSHRDRVPSSSNVDKQIQAWRGELENSVSSLGTGNALPRIKRTMKDLWNSYKVDGNRSSRKKNSKKCPVVDPYSVSSVPSKVQDRCEIRAITEYRNDEEALDNAAIMAHRALYSISMNAMESKSSTSKNTNSSQDPLMVEGPAGLVSWNNGMPRKDSATQKEVEAMKSMAKAHRFRYENNTNNDREFHLSFHSYSNPQRDHKKICRREENELPTFLPEQDDTPRISKFIRKDPNPPLYKASDVFYGRGVNRVPNNSSMPIPRRNVEPHTDNSWSLLQQKDICSGSNGKGTIEPLEPMAIKRKQINQRVYLASDSGTCDDIPMEIVELMAKNQYERRLPNRRTNGEESRFDTNHLQQNHMLWHNNASVRSQEQPSNGIQCSSIGSKWLNCTEFKQRNGTIDHLPVSERNKEAAHIWCSSSSLIPDHLPNGFQRFPAHFTGRENISSPRSLQMGNAKAQKLAESSFRRRSNGIELEQNLVGSLELYSNESILAMHLLSLIDSGMRSNEHTTGGRLRKSSKKPPIPRPLKRNEFSVNSAVHDEVHTPATTASASNFQRSRGFGTNTNFSGQAVFKSRNSANMKCSDRSTCRTFPDNRIQKGVVKVPNAEALVQQIGRNSKECKFMADTRTLQNQKSSFETEICSVNKNPADFSLPEAGNIYMIGAEDFKFGRTLHYKNRSSPDLL